MCAGRRNSALSIDDAGLSFRICLLVSGTERACNDALSGSCIACGGALSGSERAPCHAVSTTARAYL
eukprot:1557460-Rhodomonas_salina.3